MLREERGSANLTLEQGKLLVFTGLSASPGLRLTLGPPPSAVRRSSQFNTDAATLKTMEAHGLALKSGAPWCPHPFLCREETEPCLFRLFLKLTA